MTSKRIIIVILFLVGIFMLSFIVFPKKPTTSKVNPPIGPQNSNTPNLTPESMRGEIKATLAAPLKSENKSNITGETTFKEINGKIFIGVILKNASSAAKYPAFIHYGTCEQTDRQKYSLTPVLNGKTENYIKKTMEEFKKEFPLSVKIHKSATDSASFISCADLK